MRLTLVISSLGTGGAERVISILANYWADHDHDVSLLTFDDGSELPAFPLDPRIRHTALDLIRDSTDPLTATWRNSKRVRALRSAIRECNPDCVISFLDQTNVLTLLAGRGLKVPVIVSERTNPNAYPTGLAWKYLRSRLYPKADRVVMQTARAASYFSASIQSRSSVIPNPVLAPDSVAEPLADILLTRPSLIAMGRLDQWKGYDLLLRAFAQSRGSAAGWSLTILGDGPGRRELETLSRELGIDRVHFLGRVPNPYQFLKQADLFVMASRFEGFPMALCEAMACGLPVISTDCPNGPREIISDGENGILVPNGDVAGLAAAIDRLISDEGERQRLGAQAARITETFGLPKVMGMWDALLAEVVKGKR